MNKKDIILAGLAPANGAFHSPVQVQKLFFLIDRNIANDIGGPYFNFQPYGYGPSDKTIYMMLEGLQNEGLVEISSPHRWKQFRLTELGQRQGIDILEALPYRAKNYFHQVSAFIRALSFSQLVAAIYKAYPVTRSNGVFQN